MSNSKFSRFNLLVIISILMLAFSFSACNDDGNDITDGDTEQEKSEDGDTDEAVDGDLDSETETAVEDEIEVELEEEVDEEKPVATKMSYAYAETEINPPIGSKLGGYGMPGLGRSVTAVHDPIMLQISLFVNDANEAFAMITVDASGFSYDFGDYHNGIKGMREKLSQDVSSIIDIAPEAIMVSSSHSHSAPDLVGFWQDIGEGVPTDYLDDIFSKASAAMVEAANNLQEANIYFGQTTFEGYTKRDDECSEIIDNTLSIIQAKDMDGNLIATLVNFAKHPTALGTDNTEATADFLWGFREEMKKQTGSPAMYAQGFIAAVHGGYGEGDDNWERAYDFGKILAEATIDASDNLTLSKEFSIYNLSKEYTCVVNENTALYLAINNLKNLKRYYTEEDGVYSVDFIEVSWHKIGEIEFAGFPGEGSPEYSLNLREKMVSSGKFLIGLANDELGYILDLESIENDPGERLSKYELGMGLGIDMGPTTYKAHEELGWFNGAAVSE